MIVRPQGRRERMQYRFVRGVTAEDIVRAIGRPDIKSTEVVIYMRGNELVVDFGSHKIGATEERKLEALLRSFGYRFVEKGEKLIGEEILP